MKTPGLLALLCAFLCAVIPAGSVTLRGGDVGSPPLLDDRHLATIRLTFTADNWDKLTESWRDIPSHEHPYVPADFEWDGQRVEQVGVRLKGNGSLHESKGNKFPFKVDFNRYVAGQRFQGLKKVNLHNNSQDPSQLRDFLSYGAWRSSAMPACRTGFADVWLGDERLGLYTLVEQMDDDFIERHFGNDHGDLYKPEFPAGTLVWAGDDIAAYEGVDLKFHDDTDHAAFLRMVKTINDEDVEAFPGVVDVDNVIRYFAGNTALGNGDTYATKAHNYYLYEATENAFSVLPWDMNLSQAPQVEVFPGGRYTPEQDNGDRPVWDQRPLLDKLMESDVHRLRYLEALRAMLRGPGARQALFARIDAAEALLGARLDPAGVNELRGHIAQRVAELSAKVDDLIDELPDVESFLRGDCSGDGVINLTDASCTLNWLFASGPMPACIAAVNTNGDSRIDVADPVSLLNFLFAGGPGPARPFPDCGPGTLPTDEQLGCANSPDC